MGSGNLTNPPDKKAVNSVDDRHEVLQWERSSAMSVSLDDLLLVHFEWMDAPKAAATPLAARMMVVAHLSLLDLPLAKASEAAELSMWKRSSFPLHLSDSRQRVARKPRDSSTVVFWVAAWPRASFFAKK